MSYCSSCGLPIPDGQGSSCSYCYGDMNYGKDGYYREWAEEQERQWEIEEQARQEAEHQSDAIGVGIVRGITKTPE